MARGRILSAFLLLAAAAPAEEAGMVLIPAGTFQMGRTKTTSDDATGMRPKALRDDRPVHAVALDAYYLDAREVSQRDYALFLAASGRTPPYHWLDGKPPAGKEDYAVHNVDWSDAAAYCAWADKRLPSEAEWERAARGGLEGMDYPWGDESPAGRARFNTAQGPGPAGKFEQNAFGLYDMAGGVAEWCADWFERAYYETGPEKNPQGPAAGMYKAIRGGSWASGPRRITVFFRNWVRPNQKTPNIGFRCAKDAEDRE